MVTRRRILFGLALGFLVPLLWLGFRAVFFDSETVMTASFQRRAGWFDGAASAILGWMVGSIFANGFTLKALGELFSNPAKALQPAIASLVGSRFWHGAGLLVLVAETAGILQNVPRRLPELSAGFAWYHSDRGVIAEEASAQKRSIGKLGAYLRASASEVANRQVALATVRSPKLFGPLEAEFIEVSVETNQQTGCDSLTTGPVSVNVLLNHPCLAEFRGDLAAAIATGRLWSDRKGELDLTVKPGPSPTLAIKKAGVMADERLASLLAEWQTQSRLTQSLEVLALEESTAAFGKEILTTELLDRAITRLLPSGTAWLVLSPAVKASRLSSLLRLIYSCSNCGAVAQSRLLDRIADPVRAKFARSKPGGGVSLVDDQLANEWARIAGWWAAERKDSKLLDVALLSLYGCGAEVHRILFENFSNSATEYLEPETRETMKNRVAHYSRRSEDFCEAVVAKAQGENPWLRPLLNEWMTEAVKKQTSCDLGSVLYGAAGTA